MGKRTFYNYVDGKRKNPLNLWLHTLPKPARAGINQLVIFLESAPEMLYPQMRRLQNDKKNNAEGLLELRLNQFKRSYRPIGFDDWHAGTSVVLLLGAEHVKTGFSPPTVIIEAQEIKGKLTKNETGYDIVCHRFD